mgnify:CR=1 FL=1
MGKNIYDPDVCLPELRKAVGMVFQKPNPLPISVYENIVFGLRIHNEYNSLSRTEIDNLVELSLKEVFLWDSLKDKLKTKATNLQLEQQQTLCIARLLPLKPQIILMDEPLGALDKQLREKMQFEITGLAHRLGITVVYVTHDQTEALTMSDRVAVFNDGRIQQLATPDQLYEEPENSFVAQFIGENNTLNGTISDLKSDVATVKLDNGDIICLLYTSPSPRDS